MFLNTKSRVFGWMLVIYIALAAPIHFLIFFGSFRLISRMFYDLIGIIVFINNFGNYFIDIVYLIISLIILVTNNITNYQKLTLNIATIFGIIITSAYTILVYQAGLMGTEAYEIHMHSEHEMYFFLILQVFLIYVYINILGLINFNFYSNAIWLIPVSLITIYSFIFIANDLLFSTEMRGITLYFIPAWLIIGLINMGIYFLVLSFISSIYNKLPTSLP